MSTKLAIVVTCIIDFMIIAIIIIFNIQNVKFKFDILNNIKYVSNDIVDRLGMFVIYFFGFKNTFEFGDKYIFAINFDSLVTDAGWDISYSILTCATLDCSKDRVDYKQSIKNAYILILMIIISVIVISFVLYPYYTPNLKLIIILISIEIIDFLFCPSIWIKQQYMQINYSAYESTFHETISKILRIICSFIPSPFCTYIGQMLSTVYLIFVFNIFSKKRYYLDGKILKMHTKNSKIA